MKVTREDRTRPAITLTSYTGGSGATPGTGLVATGSNGGTEWAPVIRSITADGNLLVGPFINFAAGSNITLTRDMPGAVASNTIRIHSTGGGGSLTVEDEGTPLATSATTLNFVGAGVAATGAGATKTITISGGGGGGSGNVVAQAAGDVDIPGLAGSADREPSSPHADDDEFDSTDTDPITGWTTLGSPTTLNENTTALSRLYMKANAAALGLHGIYKASPSMPFTVTAEMSDYVSTGGNARAQIAVLEAGGAGKILSFGFPGNNTRPSDLIVDFWTNRTSYASTPVAIVFEPGARYLRMIVTSSTNIQCQFSLDGTAWWNFGASLNPGLTVGAVGYVLEGHTSGQAAELVSDWMRFT
jgi:hypothetical protein